MKRKEELSSAEDREFLVRGIKATIEGLEARMRDLKARLRSLEPPKITPVRVEAEQPTAKPRQLKQGRPPMDPKERRAVSERMTRYWAERRKAKARGKK